MIGCTFTEEELAVRLLGMSSAAAASCPQLQREFVGKLTTVWLSPFCVITWPPRVPTGCVWALTGSGSTTCPEVSPAIRNILLAVASVLQMALSGPTISPLGRLFDVGVLNSCTARSG